MSEARQKLAEASYFLAKMKEMSAPPPRPEEFGYNLSAFVSAARSVTLFMQVEFSHIDGFQAWWSVKQDAMKVDPEMALLNAQRVLTIHTNNLKPSQSVIIEVPGTVVVSVGKHGPAIHIVDEAGNDVEASGVGTSQVLVRARTHIEYLFQEVPNKDVLSICNDHVAKLERLVNDCESRIR
jgi:hypothetical protein